MTDPVKISRVEDTVDFRAPDYRAIFIARAERLKRLRAMTPRELALLKAHYKANPWDFINDWAVTVDPRVIARERAAVMPFILFPRQLDMVHYIVRKWRSETPGLVEKSRDIGASWVAVALACTLCLFYDDLSIGFGSRKEEYVDKLGFPKCLFYKARMFMAYIPPEFLGGFMLSKHAPHMRITFPGTRSVITGEAGDGIGRGDRTALYFVDESAHLERPQLVDMALSATTNCRVDMSSVNGTANSFAERRHSGKVEVFTFHWREDPRKDEKWYAKFLDENGPIVTAQEVDLNYAASVDMQIIPAAWVSAAVDAHLKLKLDMGGRRRSALDVADSGLDKCAWGWKEGNILRGAEMWSGNDSDIHETAVTAAGFMETHHAPECTYDSIGVGAGIKGAANVINMERRKVRKPTFAWTGYNGAGAVLFPEAKVIGENGQPLDKKNKDHYLNKAAQDWFALRLRFLMTHRALTGKSYNPSELISIDSNIKNKGRLLMELSQPQYGFTSAGKIQVEKTPEGTMSPNLADMVRMLYCVEQPRLSVADGVMDRI